MRWRAALVLAAAALPVATSAQDTQAALRVCADPDNMPFSREDGAGFENRIAELLARDMKLPLRYEWLPDRRAFVRKTLGTGRCDVIMGVPVAFERTAVSRPYYRSTYVLVQPASATPVTSLGDPALTRLRLGVQLMGNDGAASPPAEVLARRGVVRNVRGFPLAGEEPAAKRIVDAIAQRDLDAAILWGPQAGYFAAHSAVPMRVLPLRSTGAGVPFDFAIGIGVRRPDRDLRDRLDDFIARRQGDIDRILDEYAVPRMAGGTS